MGGDEFAVLLPDADAAPRRATSPRAIGAALRDEFVLDGMPLHVDASIGIALCPDHGRDRSLLLARADTAMYAAKRGRARVRGLGARTAPRTRATGWRPSSSCAPRWTTDQLDCRTTSPSSTCAPATSIGVEALVRWKHPRPRPALPRRVPAARRAGRPDAAARPAGAGALAARPRRSGGRRGHDLSVAVEPVGLQPPGRRAARPGRDAAGRLRGARRRR